MRRRGSSSSSAMTSTTCDVKRGELTHGGSSRTWSSSSLRLRLASFGLHPRRRFLPCLQSLFALSFHSGTPPPDMKQIRHEVSMFLFACSITPSVPTSAHLLRLTPKVRLHRINRKTDVRGLSNEMSSGMENDRSRTVRESKLADVCELECILHLLASSAFLLCCLYASGMSCLMPMSLLSWNSLPESATPRFSTISTDSPPLDAGRWPPWLFRSVAQ